jgi:hypothetical protein
MSTEWVVTTVSERLLLDEHRHGETTFTVTNPNPTQDRAVFEAVPGEGADPTWFHVDDPQRLIRGAESVSYRVEVTVPPQAPPGDYALQGRVYSAESAPEESSVLSDTVLVGVKPAAPPQPKRKPWWVFAAALAIMLLVVCLACSRCGGDTPPSGTAFVPDVAALTADQAKAALERAGLTIRFKYRFSTSPQLLTQSVPPGTEVARGSVVEVTAPTAVTAPVAKTPPAQFTTSPTQLPTLTWTQTEPFVRSWRVQVYQSVCNYPSLGSSICELMLTIEEIVRTPSYTPVLRFTLRPGKASGVFHEGLLAWVITAVDDFGNYGPAMPKMIFNVRP